MPKVKPKPAPLPWPERVKALLERYDLTQAELGQRLGVTGGNVSQFVNGTRVPPKPIRKLVKLMETGDDLARLEMV